MSIVTCKTAGCINHQIGIDVPDDGTQVICGGGCGNILRQENSAHPNYPDIPEPEPIEPEPTLEELVEARLNDKLRELGLIE